MTFFPNFLSRVTALMAFLSFGPDLCRGGPVDEIPVSEDYVLRTWELTEGLPDNHISSLTRTSEGYLWLTTYSGLVRFDGERFVITGKETFPGLPSPWVAPVFAASDQSLWLGLERGGMVRWHDGKLQPIAPIVPRPTSVVWYRSFTEDSTGAVWFGSSNDGRAFRSLGGKVDAYSQAEGVPAGSAVEMRVANDGKVWVFASGGCGIFDGQRFQPVDPAGGGDVCLAPASEGGMWATRGGKLLRYGPSGEREEVAEAVWQQGGGQTKLLHEDGSGTLWIGTLDAGMICYRDGKFRRVPTSFNDISCLTEDREGNLWIGTWGGGLNRISPREFFIRQRNHGLRYDGVSSLCEDPEGRLWILGRDGVPMRSADAMAKSFERVAGWPKDRWASVLCTDPRDGIWIGTSSGLMRWKNDRLAAEPFTDSIQSLATDRADRLWIASSDGSVFRLHEGSLMEIPRDGGLVEGRAMAEDSSGQFWIGTRQGHLFRGQNDRFVKVPLPGAGAEETVRFIVPDGKDTMWIGTLLGGIYRWKDGRTLRMPGGTGITLMEVRSLAIEPGKPGAQDTFWIGTATGLFRVPREEIEGVLEGRRKTMNVISCGSNEGLPNAEFSQGFSNSALRTRDGRLWFATNRGALEIRPRTGPYMSTTARVIIEEADSSSLTLRTNNPPEWIFPPNPASIRLRYTLPELRAPEQVRFRYRFAGADDGEWISAGSQRETMLVRPSPGNYRFEVSAAVADGPWLPDTAIIPFSVRPAWWQTRVFQWGMALAGVGAVAAAVRSIEKLRMRVRIRRLKQQRAVEIERTRIARDMHDELGANLTYIAATSRLAVLDPPEAAFGHLHEISSVVRQTVDSLDEIVWAVNPGNDTLASLTEYIGKFAVRFLAASGVEGELDLPHNLPEHPLAASVRHHLFLAVKEALNNVAKHSGARMATLTVKLDGEVLRIVVADDGRGFAPDKTSARSNGLRNMRERMEGIGGSCHIDTGNGTRAILELPLQKSLD